MKLAPCCERHEETDFWVDVWKELHRHTRTVGGPWWCLWIINPSHCEMCFNECQSMLLETTKKIFQEFSLGCLQPAGIWLHQMELRKKTAILNIHDNQSSCSFNQQTIKSQKLWHFWHLLRCCKQKNFFFCDRLVG